MSRPIVEERHFSNSGVIRIKDCMHDKKVIGIVWIIYRPAIMYTTGVSQ